MAEAPAAPPLDLLAARIRARPSGGAAAPPLDDAALHEQVIAEAQLEAARLGGAPCRGAAWTCPTHLKVRTGPKTLEAIVGIRPWRGMALFPGAPPAEMLERGRAAFDGPCLDGEAVRHVRAEVFVHAAFRRRDGAAGFVTVVEFVGAGNLR